MFNNAPKNASKCIFQMVSPGRADVCDAEKGIERKKL